MDYNILFQQLGGFNHFVAMTGAGRFTYNQEENSLTFKLPTTKKNRINIVKIILAGDDTYTVQFSRWANYKLTLVREFTGVYEDALIQVFEMTTGLSLQRIR